MPRGARVQFLAELVNISWIWQVSRRREVTNPGGAIRIRQYGFRDGRRS
jgi:hypothetical protein